MAEEQIVISKAEYDSLLESNARLAQAVQNLEEQLRLARIHRFGSRSEKSKYDNGSEQLGMELVFNELECIEDKADADADAAQADAEVTEEPEVTVTTVRKPRKHATNSEKLPENV